MNATILYISKSGKSATVKVTEKIGFVLQSTVGFVELDLSDPEVKYAVNDVLPLPGVSKVRKEIRKAEDGTEFGFLVFE